MAPEDWEWRERIDRSSLGGQADVDVRVKGPMMDTPDGLFPGPVVDGQPTWYGTLRIVPEGWEARITDGSRWVEAFDRESNAIVQARPVPQPDPQSHRFTDAIVTTVGEMRGRIDLDQWEWADTSLGEWFPCNRPLMVDAGQLDGALIGDAPDDFPVIVRRRA